MANRVVPTTRGTSRWRLGLIGLVSVAVAALGLSPLPADAFDAAVNDAPGDSRIISSYSTGQLGSTVHVADVNGDGIDDLLVGQPELGPGESGTVNIYLGPSTGSLTDQPLLADAGGPGPAPGPDKAITGPPGFGRLIETGDFNGNGSPDLAVADGNNVYLFSFPAIDFPGLFDLDPVTVALPATDLAVGNFDGALGNDDLAIASPTTGPNGEVHLFHGPLVDGDPADVTITGGGDFGVSLAAGQIVGDPGGTDDLAVGSPLWTNGSFFEAGRVDVFDQPGVSSIPLTFSDIAVEIIGDVGSEARFGSDLLIADISASTDPDLVVASQGVSAADASEGEQPSIVRYAAGPLTIGADFFDISMTQWAPGFPSGTLGPLAGGDVDGDGLTDLAAGGNDLVFVAAHGFGQVWQFNGATGTGFGSSIAIADNQYMAVGAPTTDTTDFLGQFYGGANGGAVELFITTTSAPPPGGPYVVNSVGGALDGNPGDGVCETSVAGQCTLAAAIAESNASGGDTIEFAIPGTGPHVINVATPLPEITSPTLIDGLSQPDATGPFDSGPMAIGIREVEPVTNGLVFAAGSDGSTVRGLAISGFQSSAIFVAAGDITVEQNRLGIRTQDLPSQNQAGITVDPDATATLISDNLISNNTNVGIDSLGTGTIITQNLIGTNPDGTVARPNGLGINVADDAAVITGNLISGNNEWGIQLKDGYSTITANRIGISATDNPLGNASGGINADNGAPGPSAVVSTVGSDTVPGDRNEIAFNGGPGIFVGNNSYVAVLGNLMGSNDGLGIDIAPVGVNPNDPGDGDDGPNGLLNSPVIDSVSLDVSGPAPAIDTLTTIDISNDVVSLPVDQYRVEYFASNNCDPSGFGEGRTFLTSFNGSIISGPNTIQTSILTADFGAATNLTTTVTVFAADPGLPPEIPAGAPVATSEFSNCVSILTDAEVDAVSLTVDTASTGPGLTSIPLIDIPIEAVLGASSADSATEAAPLGAVPLSAVDLSASPLGAVPLSAVPLSAVPLTAVPLSAVPLSAVPLSAVDFPGGWSTLLEGTEFEGQVPQAVGFLEFLDSLPAGHPAQSIPLSAVDLSATPLGAVSLAAVALAGAPLGAVAAGELCPDALAQGIGCDANSSLIGLELSGYDIASAPLGAVPLTAVPLGAVPLGAVPLTAVPLTAVPLSAVPLGAVPLGAVPLGAVPLGAVDIGGVPLSAVPLGAVPLTAVELAGVPLGAVPLSAVSFDGRTGCDLLAGAVVDCTDPAIDEGSTLAEIEAALVTNGSSLAQSPLGAVPLSAVPLGAVPLTAVPLSAVDLGAFPLGAVPLTAVALDASPLGAVPLSAVAFGGSVGCDLLTDPALDCAALGIDDTSTLFELAVLLESAGSSLAASPLGAVPLSAVPLSAVLVDDGEGITTLADLFGPAASLADLPSEVLDQLSLADILLALLVVSDYPWEEIDFLGLGLQDFVDDATEIGYTASLDVTGDGLVAVSVSLPIGYRYRDNSSTFAAAPATDPVIDDAPSGQVLTWFLDVTTGTGLALDFDVSPGFALGTTGSDVTATGSTGASSQVNAAPHTIVAPAEPAAAAADVLQLGYLTAPSESDTYNITSPGPGYTTSVFLSHLSEDTDLVLYRPTNAPPPGGGGETADAPTTQVIEDDGFDQVLRGATEAESLGDVPAISGFGPVESSAGRGVGDEEVDDYRSESATAYGIQVSGYNGATSADPYVLRVKFQAEQPVPDCPARNFPTVNYPGAALPPGLETILVFDRGRTEAVHGAAGADAVLASAQQLIGFLNDPANGFGSAAIYFADDVTDFGTWDANPCDWEAADAVAKSIRVELADYAVANESLRYVTILGDDTVIPFHRQVDATGYANEESFAAEVDDDAIFGSLSTRHILTDHPYGDPDPIPWLDRFLYLPEVAVGRLVESPTEIAQAITTFTNFGGDLDPASTALVTGYDFLTDGANATADALDDNFTTSRIISETWTDDDLENSFLTADGPRIVSANAHYDNYRALPAAEQLVGEATYTENTLFQVDDVEAFLDGGGDLQRNFLFTMGCHAALSVSDVTVGASPALDWAQLYGGSGGVLTGNTGFGYGDTITVALSEELIVGLADALDGRLTLGQAAVDSMQTYYGRAGLYGVYDEKALQQFTTYGLPMYRVPGTGSETPTTPPTVSIDGFTGQPSATVIEDVTVTSEATPYGQLFSVDGQTLDIHYRPIQPMTSVDITVDGLVARGAIITNWTSTDQTVTDIAYSRPIIDDSDRESEIEDDSVIFPSTFAAIANFERPSTEPGRRTEQRQNLNLIVGQYNAPSDVQRLFDNVEAEIFYVDPDGALADDDQPAVINQVQAVVVEGTVGFVVDLDDNAAAARVLVLYRSDVTNEWSSIDLVSGSPWSGGGAVPAGTTEVEYVVQVVKASGLVSVSSSKGTFHRATPEPVTPPSTPALTVVVDGVQGDPWYTGPVTVGVSGTNAPFEVTVDGEAVTPGSFTIAEDGVHIVVVTGADGTSSTLVVPVDRTSPEIGIGTPAIIDNGATAFIDYECRDAGSGVATCNGPALGPIDTTVPGTYSFTVTSTDVAGNPATTVTHTYEVLPPSAVFLTVDPMMVTLGETVSATITSQGSVTAVSIDWGDGTSTDAASGSHVYAAPGIYEVTAIGTLPGGGVTTATSSAVVFDPSGSYVAGNGKLDVPAGSWTPDPGASGRVDVQFNPKYSGSKNKLTGHIKVKGKDIDFDVITSSLDFMVVAGAHATIQGQGILDPTGQAVGVQVVTVDGDRLADDAFDEDLVKVRIWDLDTGEVLFQTALLAYDGDVKIKK